MRTEAEHIAEGIREYVAKLNELLELARMENMEVKLRAYNWESHYWQFDQRGQVLVDSIHRTEIL